MKHLPYPGSHRILLLVGIFILMTPSCAPALQTVPTPPASAPASQARPVDTATSAPVLQDTLTPTQAPTAAPTRPTQPVVVAHYCLLADCSHYQYPGDFLSGNMGGIDGVMLVLLDQIWTAAYPQGIQEWDPHDGHLINSISANYEVGNFMDIQYDGKLIWASQYVPTSTSDSYRVFYAIDPLQGKLVKKISLKYGENDYHSFLFGVSPGKVWLEQQWIDTNTFQIHDASHYFACPDQHFAYDGQGLLWVTGDVIPDLTCDRYLYVWNASDPNGQPLPSDTHDAFSDSPLVMANGKMWMMTQKEVKSKSGWEKHWILTAFDLKDATKPVIQVDISQYMPELNGDLIMAADNKAIWVVPDDIKGDVEYFDQADGSYLGSLHVGQLIEGMGFDGSSLWVMDNEHGLEQIALPWAP